MHVTQSALFNFSSMVMTLVLMICTFAYIHIQFPSLLDGHKKGLPGLPWKMARIGERLSPWVAVACIALGIKNLFFA